MRHVTPTLLWLLIFVPSCAHQRVIRPGTPRNFLFPHGIYKHSVRVTTSAKESYSFRGVVKISTEMVYIVGLSPFGTTVFRIEEDRKSGRVSVDVFQDAAKKYEPRIVEFYSGLRAFLLLPSDPKLPQGEVKTRNAAGLPEELRVLFDGSEVRVMLRSYDEQRIPEEITISHPRFEVEIEVTGYEI